MIKEAAIALEQGHFSNKHTKIMIETLQYAKRYLSNESNRFILVHSDLGKSNLIYHDNRIIPIDFSLSGYCIPEMDIASIFSHVNDESLNKTILSGYKSICKIQLENRGIDVCFCLQILLFLVAQHRKIEGQPWLNSKLDGWCKNQFIPLITESM